MSKRVPPAAAQLAILAAALITMSGCTLPSSSWQATTPVGVTAVNALAVPGSVVVTGRVISTGGGNVISTGGGNVISTGGGNVISTGGGNFTLLHDAGVSQVALRFNDGRTEVKEVDADGSFRFEVAPDANGVLPVASELYVHIDGKEALVRFQTGGDATTSWFPMLAGQVFDFGAVKMEGDQAKAERNPLEQVDSDRDGQNDAADLDDDGDTTPDSQDPGKAAFDKSQATPTDPGAKDTDKQNASPQANLNGNANGNGAGGVKEAVTETVSTTTGPVTEAVSGAAGGASTVVETTTGVVESTTGAVGSVIDKVTGNDKPSGSTDTSGSTSSGSTSGSTSTSSTPVEKVVEKTTSVVKDTLGSIKL